MRDSPQDTLDAARWDAVEEATEVLLGGDPEGALPLLRAALERDPSNAYAHFYLGAAHFERGEFEQARAAYAKALEHAPEYLGATVSLGHALRMLDRHAEALRAGERALGLRKDDPDALYLLGITHAEKGEKLKAIRYFERFLETRPEVEAKHEVEAMLAALKGRASPRSPW